MWYVPLQCIALDWKILAWYCKLELEFEIWGQFRRILIVLVTQKIPLVKEGLLTKKRRLVKEYMNYSDEVNATKMENQNNFCGGLRFHFRLFYVLSSMNNTIPTKNHWPTSSKLMVRASSGSPSTGCFTSKDQTYPNTSKVVKCSIKTSNIITAL